MCVIADTQKSCTAKLQILHAPQHYDLLFLFSPHMLADRAYLDLWLKRVQQVELVLNCRHDRDLVPLSQHCPAAGSGRGRWKHTTGQSASSGKR